MSQTKYALGIDYGTLSGRAVLASVENGSIIADAVFEYPHAVCDSSDAVSALTGVKTDIVPGTALQHPSDYIDVLKNTVPKLLEKTGIAPENIVGIGIDFTSCTPMPVKADGTPLCFIDEYRGNPHSYVKLWKHHGAIKETDFINAHIPKELVRDFGGAVSCEAMIPKLWEIKNSAPEIYDACELFVEAGDWIIHRLTGCWAGSSCMAGYKAQWTKERGYPSEFIASLPGLENAVDKLIKNILEPGDCAGYLTKEAAALTGLCEGTPVSAAMIDAHSCVPGAGVSKPGVMCAIIGTSACYMLLSKENPPVEGCCGIVDGGILPGFYGYEAGQCCLGDHFEWFIENCLPKSYYDEAEKRGMSVHALLTEKASALSCGSGTADSGALMALDWWNGNRSVLCDHTLTGMIVGLTLNTRPEQIYRALIEATAYGARRIIEAFEESGIRIESITATGGIPQKNKLLDKIYADVLGIPVITLDCDLCGALGAAMLGASASGVYGTLGEAVEKMCAKADVTYMPDAENAKKYDILYEEYKKLHDCFGRGENDVMKRLRGM
nr:ribulokinase [Clostridia bacterium]